MPNFRRDFSRNHREFDSKDRRESRGRGSFSRGGRGGRERLEMHDVTCDKCGKECQVPFKPTGDKPVFCSNCYEKQEGSRSRSFGDRNENRSFSGSSSGISK
jgi:CxxC-x17-CxxC domain-containing protein